MLCCGECFGKDGSGDCRGVNGNSTSITCNLQTSVVANSYFIRCLFSRCACRGYAARCQRFGPQRGIKCYFTSTMSTWYCRYCGSGVRNRQIGKSKETEAFARTFPFITKRRTYLWFIEGIVMVNRRKNIPFLYPPFCSSRSSGSYHCSARNNNDRNRD